MREFKKVLNPKLSTPKKPVYFQPEQVHYSADLHAYHLKMARGVSPWPENETRDFADEVVMTEVLIANINKYVKTDDLFIFGGDWSFGGIDKIIETRLAINCKNVILLLGNHDQHIAENKRYFLDDTLVSKLIGAGLGGAVEVDLFDRQSIKLQNLFLQVAEVLFIEIGKQEIVLCHYPMTSWFHTNKGTWMLSGHCHANLPVELYRNRSLDIGVDNAYKLLGEYRPFSHAEIKTYMDAIVIQSDGHHRVDKNS